MTLPVSCKLLAAGERIFLGLPSSSISMHVSSQSHTEGSSSLKHKATSPLMQYSSSSSSSIYQSSVVTCTSSLLQFRLASRLPIPVSIHFLKPLTLWLSLTETENCYGVGTPPTLIRIWGARYGATVILVRSKITRPESNLGGFNIRTRT